MPTADLPNSPSDVASSFRPSFRWLALSPFFASSLPTQAPELVRRAQLHHNDRRTPRNPNFQITQVSQLGPHPNSNCNRKARYRQRQSFLGQFLLQRLLRGQPTLILLHSPAANVNPELYLLPLSTGRIWDEPRSAKLLQMNGTKCGAQNPTRLGWKGPK